MPRRLADAAATPEIEFAQVTKVIEGKTILADVSLQVARGERVALIGPSGAGKTTLLRMVAGVLWPSVGRVRVLGTETGAVHGRSLCQLRKQVGFLYQSDNLVPGLRVAHNVLMGRLGKWSLWRAFWSLLFPREVERAAASLQRVELQDRLWALPGELSGGEQQRVAIARLLLQEPKILLADEPVSSLDIRLGREIVRLLLGLAKERQSTLLVSLHTLELLGEGFDRVVALQQGRIVWQGPPAALTRDLLQQVYGAEYRTLQLDALPLAGRTA
ncbi:MAG: ATP-binding cassette domain-containing protein [Planctomycetes bacterium]|nr:ATP-binding cassette domain-containing protein [Planctomycetota bacterium]